MRRRDIGPSPIKRYDGTTIALHWIVAFGIAVQWLGAHAIDWFPAGAARVEARSVHIIGGLLLTGAIEYRLFWRMRRGAHFGPPSGSLLHWPAKIMHVMLYATLASVLLLGLLNTWIRGDSIFGWFHIPYFGAYDAADRHMLANKIVGLHRLSSSVLLIMAGLHAGAGLFHHLYKKDDLMRRMIPWL